MLQLLPCVRELQHERARDCAAVLARGSQLDGALRHRPHRLADASSLGALVERR